MTHHEAPLWGIPIAICSPHFDPPSLHFVTVDVGVRNMAAVLWRVDVQWLHPEVVDFECIDLTAQYAEDDAGGKELSDRVPRCLRRYADYFGSGVSAIFIERQPPSAGVKAVEQLLYDALKPRAHLISPVSMHAHFRMGRSQGLRYGERKHRSTRLWNTYLTSYGSEVCRDKWARFPPGARVHDVADAGLIGIFVVERKRTERVAAESVQS